MFLYLVLLVMSSMWNLLAGYTGLICLGHASFIGISAYTVGIFTMLNLPYQLGIVVGGFSAALLSLLIAVPTFRMRGIFFAIGTLTVSEALRAFFTTFKPTEGAIWGGAGIPIKTAISLRELYFFMIPVAIVSLIILRLILKSKVGLGLMAIRDDETAARTCGVRVFKCKLYSFLISSFFTGLAAGSFYIYQGHVEPVSAFGINWTMLLMIAVVIGGIGTLEGPLIGAGIAVFLHIALARYAGLSLLIEGLLILSIMLLQPRGVAYLLHKILKKIYP
ncbi:MAG: branched-chain amino acid ABC transporter permease [Candidatus Bathyarchaeia archaeon]